MRFFAAVTSLLLPLAAAKKTFSNNVIYDPPENYTDPQLSDGTLLATWENYSPEPPLVWFPIVKSKDGGKTWKEISRVHDTQNGWGLRYQPFLYQLPEAIGDFEKGTVLISGSSIPTNLSQTLIEVYASRDKGYTWEFVSHVALGGEAKPEHGLTPVWEPFLMTYKKQLVLYYSDQRDNATHSQKLVHQTTTDLLNWSEVVEDTKYDDYFARPGMPIVAKLPNGKYFYVYEYGGGPGSDTYWFPVYYRISSNPLGFLDVPGQQIIATDGTKPAGSPYVVWSSYGGKNGTIIVSCGTLGQIFTNQALGHPDAWKAWDVPQPAAYTRALLSFKKDPELLMIMGAGNLPPGKTNEVSLSVVDLKKIMKK
ncbi:BNR Asp-box repeat domain [Fusarium albosuccineum]|uniref:BNR Asp-box repeat domain n=1 Tax=Fusarium albosuccineum TaxID=1237068 RepID=A0A8H4P4D8_9HYPO|nr:BNR Asp-box repeat domain [Fusarium albosuccineum]